MDLPLAPSFLELVGIHPIPPTSLLPGAQEVFKAILPNISIMSQDSLGKGCSTSTQKRTTHTDTDTHTQHTYGIAY